MNKVAEFYTKVMQDEDIKKEFLAFAGKKEADDFTDEEFKKLKQLSKRIGFDITEEEIKSYFQSEKELSDEELDNVAGGFLFFFF